MNFKFNSFKKAILLSFGILMLFSLMSFPVYAQHELNQTEQTWIEEAKSELENAISNPDLSQQERIEMVQRSAKTLKEYGQPSAFPSGDIPLKNFMEENYNLSRKQFENSNDLRQLLSNKLLDQQLKIINTMQIDVTEQQIKFLLPGNQIIDLSKDVVTSVLDWDMVSGVNGGASGSAKSLADRFKQMAQSKELIKKLDELWNAQRVSMQKLFADLNRITPLQEMLRKRYQMAEAGTIVMKGYENSVAAVQKSEPKIVEQKPQSNSSSSSVTENNVGEKRFKLQLVKTNTVEKINNEKCVSSISFSDGAASASVTPPKPDEEYTASAKWNTPTFEIYSGETLTITANGSKMGVQIIGTHSGGLNSVGKMVDVNYDNGKTVTYEWKVGDISYAGWKVTIEVTTTVAHAWAWGTAFYTYESVEY